MLLYSAFWLALLIVGLAVVTWMAKQDHDEEDSDFLGRKAEEVDHRQGLFYHPASYDDDPTSIQKTTDASRRALLLAALISMFDPLLPV